MIKDIPLDLIINIFTYLDFTDNDERSIVYTFTEEQQQKIFRRWKKELKFSYVKTPYREVWKLRNKLHRVDGPAFVRAQIPLVECNFNFSIPKNNLLIDFFHTEFVDGFRPYKFRIEYRIHGKLHNTQTDDDNITLPAFITNMEIIWCKNGRRHRRDTQIYNKKIKKIIDKERPGRYIDDKLDFKDTSSFLPAYINCYRNWIEWYKNGNIHRRYGYARMTPEGEEYWLYGKQHGSPSGYYQGHETHHEHGKLIKIEWYNGDVTLGADANGIYGGGNETE